MDHYFGVAKAEGLSDEEIGAVQSIVMAVSAGKVRAQFREARVRSKKREKKEKSSDRPSRRALPEGRPKSPAGG